MVNTSRENFKQQTEVATVIAWQFISGKYWMNLTVTSIVDSMIASRIDPAVAEAALLNVLNAPYWGPKN